MFRRLTITSILAGLAPSAGAETRGVLRFGLMPLELESSSDTPLFGERVGRAVDRYNAAAAALDRETGSTTARIDESDLGVTETLFVISPGIEAGRGAYFFRLEAPIGLASDVRSIGLGVYPLNLQARVRRGLALYGSAGVSASWLDRPGTGDVGGLVAARIAGGVRFARHFVAEVGYSAFALGGSVNSERLDAMELPADRRLPAPDSAISAGEAHGLVDVSVGVTF